MIGLLKRWHFTRNRLIRDSFRAADRVAPEGSGIVFAKPLAKIKMLCRKRLPWDSQIRCIGLLSFLMVVISAGPTPAQGTAAPFYMGADISLETFMQQQGVVFTDNGTAAPLDQILYNHGDNLFRLRIFVNPQTTYTTSSSGAMQTQAYDIALAQQIKANDPNAKFLLDFHYSDTWADPGHQSLPAAWTGQSLTQFQTTVRSYTQNTLLAFKNAGVMPDMVQVGNEINSGMIFPAGQINFNGTTPQQQASWQAFGSLIKSAIQGVRLAQGTGPAIQVAIHIANGAQNGEPQYFFGKLSDPSYGNVSLNTYDIMGFSYYPSATTDLSQLSTNLTAVANSYNKKIMILETNQPWESTNAPANDPSYPNTPAGQLQFLTDLRNTVKNLPNSTGMGIVYWYPEAVLVPGFSIYNGGSTALFDNNRNALPALNAFASAKVRGDFNNDGKLNAADLTLMLGALTNLSNYQSTYGLTNPDLLAIGDFNNDHVLNNADLQGMLSTLSSGAGSAAIVPEPASCWLAFLGGVILIVSGSLASREPQ